MTGRRQATSIQDDEDYYDERYTSYDTQNDDLEEHQRLELFHQVRGIIGVLCYQQRYHGMVLHAQNLTAAMVSCWLHNANQRHDSPPTKATRAGFQDGERKRCFSSSLVFFHVATNTQVLDVWLNDRFILIPDIFIFQ
jgi:hypothetical protein